MPSHDGTPADGERHLARRLEGFGDVVFGFSISQLALQLDLPRTPEDLYAHPLRYVLYFGTFSLLALLWLAFHRMLAGAYRPTPVDLAVTFAYLAFVGLIPYAMYANAHFATISAHAAQYGFAAYMICAIGTATTAATIMYRNLRRGWNNSTPDARLRLWRTTTLLGGIAMVMMFALVADLTAGIVVGSAFTALAAFVPALVFRIRLPDVGAAGTIVAADGS